MFELLVCFVAVLFIAASACSILDGQKKLSALLYKLCAFFMAASLFFKGIQKEGMLADAITVPQELWLRAVLAIVVCVTLAAAFAMIVKTMRKKQ